MTASLAGKLRNRESGLLFCGLTAPRETIAAEKLGGIYAGKASRLSVCGLDGFIVYDVQDESCRNPEPRPYPYVRSVDAAGFGAVMSGLTNLPRIQFLSPGMYSASDLSAKFRALEDLPLVLVGSPSSKLRPATDLSSAYALYGSVSRPGLPGAVAIAERHAENRSEARRMLEKMERGVEFFVTQCIYDIGLFTTLLRDYADSCLLAGFLPKPVIMTFSPAGSGKSLDFLKWLGVSVPRSVEDEIRSVDDPLAASCRIILSTVFRLIDECRDLGVPFGINIESVVSGRAENLAVADLLGNIGKIVRIPQASTRPVPVS